MVVLAPFMSNFIIIFMCKMLPRDTICQWPLFVLKKLRDNSHFLDASLSLSIFPLSNDLHMQFLFVVFFSIYFSHFVFGAGASGPFPSLSSANE